MPHAEYETTIRVQSGTRDQLNAFKKRCCLDTQDSTIQMLLAIAESQDRDYYKGFVIR